MRRGLRDRALDLSVDFFGAFCFFFRLLDLVAALRVIALLVKLPSGKIFYWEDTDEKIPMD